MDIVKYLLTKIKSSFANIEMNDKIFSSKKYWQNRYKFNGNSGPGSYGNLAIYKANVINDFVRKKNIDTVIDFGCGDGNQLNLADYSNYIGLDVSEKALEICRAKFKSDTTKNFYHYSDLRNVNIKGDLVISLDVIFHLIEDNVFDNYMKNLFATSNKYVIIYSSNYDKIIAQHVRCREFTKWIKYNLDNEFKLISFIKNSYPFDPNRPDETSMSDFFIYERIK